MVDYGPKLYSWLMSQKLEEQKIEIPALLQGVAITPKDDHIVIRKHESGTEFFQLEVEKITSTWWKVEIEGGKAIFTPNLYYIRANLPQEKKEEIFQLVFNHFGIKAKEVELPEKVISLSIPSWVGADCCNQCVSSAYPTSKLCFASEAKQMIAEFEKELEKAKEELK